MRIAMKIGMALVLVAFAVAACEGDRAVTREDTADPAAEAAAGETATGINLGDLADGWYRAAEEYDPEADWRNIVMIEVRSGEIVGGRWTAAPKTGGPDKLTYSIDGGYNMERVSQWPWHDQAEATIEHLISTQDPYDAEWDDDGVVDAISGATMTVSYFFELAREALSGEPFEPGPYNDGTYVGEGSAGDDWKDVVHITVIDGRIESVHWAPEPVGGDGPDKYEYSVEGEYGMERVSQWPWHEQADAVARFVIENQSLDNMDLDDEGETDAISGATITLSGFHAAASDAIAQAQ